MARIQMWRTQVPGTKAPPAAQVCDLLLANLPDTAPFTFDSCAGGGGPIPIMESTLNAKLHAQGQGPLCFHYFDDPDAAKVLRSAIQLADAFVIFKMTNRTLFAFLNTTFIVLSPFLTSLTWFRHSPLHLFFTYVIPLVQMFFAVDGYVSCIWGRTEEELTQLIRSQSDLALGGWEFTSGEDIVLPLFGKTVGTLLTNQIIASRFLDNWCRADRYEFVPEVPT
ncbi:hypothetical protein EYZ11_009241 [Aspergillus tanneri]|uniref:Uncharacterized protein n=1 Tax=Aspergillus tanneri TaxID=1220188 RepID=A0A4S3JDU8_9EURO|nr:hypothetical protein EYZ11_009241 [Aspergillus tanneri]